MTTFPLPLHRPPQQRHAVVEDQVLTAQLRDLVDLSNRLEQAHADVAVAVLHCREAGATWRHLGEALGLAHKTVWNRFGALDAGFTAAVAGRDLGAV